MNTQQIRFQKVSGVVANLIITQDEQNFVQTRADQAAGGITIDPAWLASYDNFLADMGERPEGRTLDRVGGGRTSYTRSNW